MSLRKAINAKCKECIYDPVGATGSWRQQVGDCTSYFCPLFEARPLPLAPRPNKSKISVEAGKNVSNTPISDVLVGNP